MTIQAIFNKNTLDYFPEIKDRIKKADNFNANQIINKTLQVCMNLHISLNKQTKEQLINTENYLLSLFKMNEWI